MTEPPAPVPPVPCVVPEPGSRLEQLRGELAEAEAAMAAVKERLDTCKDQLKLELTTLYPRTPVIKLAGSAHAPGRRVSYFSGSWTVDGPRLKTEQPAIWAQYAKKGKGGWKIEILKESAQ